MSLSGGAEGLDFFHHPYLGQPLFIIADLEGGLCSGVEILISRCAFFSWR